MTTPIQAAIAALTKIARWHGEFPGTGRTWDHGTPMSYGAAFGSNGERDYMRQVALDALAALQAAPAPIADEVAGEWVLVPIAPTEEMILATRGPNMSEPSWNSYARKRHATLYKQMIAARPPAPRTSAPDAPAGHAEPVAGIEMRFFRNFSHQERRRILQDLGGFSPELMAEVRTHSDERRLFKRLFAAPVAAEPVAVVVSCHGSDMRVGWLHPEKCEVGTKLYKFPY